LNLKDKQWNKKQLLQQAASGAPNTFLYFSLLNSMACDFSQ
jgi:hypothetical protein